MSVERERVMRIHNVTTDTENLKQGIEDLRHILFSAIHDLAVMRGVLEKNGLLTEEIYRQLRAQSMLNDHGGPGASPWKRHSYYPHTLDEEFYLKEVLGFTEEEFKQYSEECDRLLSMT